MKTTIEIQKQTFQIDLSKPIDISIPIKNGEENPNAWWAMHPTFDPVRMGTFVGSTNEGAPVNFYNVRFNPHGNGTHTECVGHIAKEPFTINKCLQQFWFKAQLVSVFPTLLENGDKVIIKQSLETALEKNNDIKALIIRTLPNENDKLTRIYGSSNPPYLSGAAMQTIVDFGFEHLLLDLPSVDRESDEGKLNAHHIFWNYPAFGTEATEQDLLKVRTKNTITEMIFVPNEVKDGIYFLNIQIASFELDASPSKPVLYEIQSI